MHHKYKYTCKYLIEKIMYMNKNKHPKKVVILTKNTNITTILTSEQHRCHSENIK